MKKSIILIITLLLLVSISLTVFTGCKPTNSTDSTEKQASNVYKIVNGEKQSVTETYYNSIRDQLREFKIVDNDFRSESFVKEQIVGTWKYRSTILRIYPDKVIYVYNKYSKHYDPNYISNKPAPEIISLSWNSKITTPEGNIQFPCISDGTNDFILCYRNIEFLVNNKTMYLTEYYLRRKNDDIEELPFLRHNYPRISTDPDFEDYDKELYDN